MQKAEQKVNFSKAAKFWFLFTVNMIPGNETVSLKQKILMDLETRKGYLKTERWCEYFIKNVI